MATKGSSFYHQMLLNVEKKDGKWTRRMTLVKVEKIVNQVKAVNGGGGRVVVHAFTLYQVVLII